MVKRFVRSSLVLFLLLASCQAQPTQTFVEAPPWRYTDLRLVKAPGNQPPSQTLAALYTRKVGSELQIRIDLLDFNTDPDFDLYLALDNRPGGTRHLPVEAQAGLDWDALITILASGEVTAVNAQGIEIPGLKLRVVLDAFQDSMMVSLDRAALGVSRTGFSLQVFTTAAKSQQISDSLGPVGPGKPTPTPAPLLLAFWNTYPATSPAQALRNWNGAHTGPFGGRHGLANLLNAALTGNIPLTLVDLKTPASLSALDTVGGGDLLHTLLGKDLLSLPDVLPIQANQGGSLPQPEWVLRRLASEGRGAAITFGIPAEPYLYSPLPPQDLPANLLAPYNLLFTPSDEAEKPAGNPLVCQRYQSWIKLSLPANLPSDLPGEQVKASQQVTSNGLSLDVRRALLILAVQNAANGGKAANPCSGEILLLGGNLATSAWGEPLMAQAAMDYIAGHPWIKSLRPEDLLGAHLVRPQETQEPVLTQGIDSGGDAQTIPHGPDGNPIASGLSLAELQMRLLDSLQEAPPGPLADAAWQMYTSLIALDFSSAPALYSLRAAYFGQVGIWLAADRWAANPEAACAVSGYNPCAYEQDVTWDGEPEYILASSSYYGVFNQRGGFLAAAFAFDEAGPHQIVGPTWQFTVGLADTSAWEANKGIAGDPRALRGAFSEVLAGYALPSWEIYSARVGREALSFTSPDGRLHKTIRLTEQGFSAQYESLDPVKVQAPLALDPWERFKPGWELRYFTPGGGQAIINHREWVWGLQDAVQVKIDANGGDLSIQPFTITQNVMGSPENPDYQFPPGHYLPLPIALAEVDAQGNFTVSLGITGNEIIR